MSYTRSVPDGGGSGFRYETKITALIALRLNNNFLQFSLASNLQNAGKFDDVVFSINDDGEWKTWFLQLKHRLPATLHKKKISVSALRNKGDLVLQQYFESYKTIANKFSRGGDDPVFGKSFAHTKFAIFTNALLDQELLGRNHTVFEYELLDTGCQNIRNVQLDLVKDEDIFQKISKDWYIRDFVGRLFLFTGQAGEDALDTLIQNEIKETVPDLNSAQLKLVAHEWSAFILKWATGGRFLEKTETQGTLNRLARAAQHGRTNDVSIRFVDSFLKNEIEQLHQVRLTHLVSDADSSIMSMAALTQMGLLTEPNQSVTLRYLSQEGDMQDFNRAWLEGENLFLVIDCEGDTLGIDKSKIALFIINLIDSTAKNRVILVSTKNNETAVDLSMQLQARRRKFNCSLKNLTDESRAMLKEREVDFQGYKTSLASLMRESKALDDVFDMMAMTQLLQGRLVRVGIKPVEMIPYYVTRLLTRKSTVSQDFFTTPDIQACFALSGISRNEALEMFQNITGSKDYDFASGIVSSTDILQTPNRRLTEKVVILEQDPSLEFQVLSKRVSLPLHWFERVKKSTKWIWKGSTKHVLDVSRRIGNARSFVATDNIMQLKEKMVVITAEPGMGKSTLLAHLAAETKKQCPHVWVICLALNDYTEHFDRPEFIRNIKVSAKNLIAAAAGVDKVTSKFDARLFNQCYDVTGDMIVLLDGFDEITPYYIEQGLALLNALEKSAVSRVWVSARPVLQETLEQACSTLSYTIKPFVVKDQQLFLRKYWKNDFPDVDDKELDKFIDKVLELIKNSFDKKLAQFTGIPLQTRMVAEVFTDEVKRFCETGNLEINHNVDGVQLFDDFVRIKRGIQMGKSKVTLTNASARFEQERLNEQREQDLMKLALLTLLPKNICETLQPPITEESIEQLKKLVNDGHEKSGIVLSFQAESPQFIHRTFAEYFVALFFAKNYASNRRFLSTDTFFSLPFEFVRYFFDHTLALGCRLHTALLRRDVAAARQALEEGVDVNGVDAGGRTALHLAAAMPHSHDVIQLLLHEHAAVDIHDAVLDGYPIDYALRIGSTDNAAPLLEGKPVKIQTLPLNNIPVEWKSLKLAVQGDYLELMKHLLDNGLQDIEPLMALSPQKWIDESINEGLTILHLVCAFNATKIWSYLQSNEAFNHVVNEAMHVKSKEGKTPLLQAAAAGYLPLARAFMDAGADPLVPTPDGKNLTAYAVEGHDLDLVCDILSNATVRKIEPATYLSCAITALVADKSDWAYTALDLLLTTFPELLSIRTTKNMSQLIAATIKGNYKTVSKLCQLGANVNEVTSLGTPLHYAVLGGQDDCVRTLLACPNINVDAVDRDGCTPLHKATLKGFPEIFKMLIDSNASLNLSTITGSNLTHAVAESCNSEIFYYLVHKDLNFLSSNAFGETGFSMLKRRKAYDLVQVLDPCFVIPEPDPSADYDDEWCAKRKKPKASNPSNHAFPILKTIDCPGNGGDVCHLAKSLADMGLRKAHPVHTNYPPSCKNDNQSAPSCEFNLLNVGEVKKNTIDPRPPPLATPTTKADPTKKDAKDPGNSADKKISADPRPIFPAASSAKAPQKPPLKPQPLMGISPNAQQTTAMYPKKRLNAPLLNYVGNNISERVQSNFPPNNGNDTSSGRPTSPFEVIDSLNAFEGNRSRSNVRRDRVAEQQEMGGHYNKGLSQRGGRGRATNRSTSQGKPNRNNVRNQQQGHQQIDERSRKQPPQQFLASSQQQAPQYNMYNQQVPQQFHGQQPLFQNVPPHNQPPPPLLQFHGGNQRDMHQTFGVPQHQGFQQLNQQQQMPQHAAPRNQRQFAAHNNHNQQAAQSREGNSQMQQQWNQRGQYQAPQGPRGLANASNQASRHQQTHQPRANQQQQVQNNRQRQQPRNQNKNVPNNRQNRREDRSSMQSHNIDQRRFRSQDDQDVNEDSGCLVQ